MKPSHQPAKIVQVTIQQIQQRILKNACFLFLSFAIGQTTLSSAQNVGVSTNGTNPDSSAGLDIDFADKGLLMPRVALTATNSASPISSPAVSLMVYNTATAGTAPNNVTPGFYFWDGTTWLRMTAENTSVEHEDDLRVVIDKGSNSAQLGSLTGISGPEIWFFRNGQGLEAMSFTLQLPHNWVDGTTIYPHIHWVPRSTGTGNVQWNLDYSWADLNEISPETFPSATTSSVVISGPFTMNQHLLSNLTAGNVGIDGTGKNYSSVLICRIWRDSGVAADTYNGDCGGLSMDFHITIRDVFAE